MIAAAERLAALANEHGWTADIVDSDDATVLKLKRDSQVLIGLWEKGRWRSGIALWRGDVGIMGARTLTELVQQAGDLNAVLDALGDVSRDKRAAREQAKRDKADEKKRRPA